MREDFKPKKSSENETDTPDMGRRQFLTDGATLGIATAMAGAGLWVSREKQSTPESSDSVMGEILRPAEETTAEQKETVPETNPFAAVFDYESEHIPEITRATLRESIQWWQAQHLGADPRLHTTLKDGLHRMQEYDAHVRQLFLDEAPSKFAGGFDSLRYIALPETYWQLNPKDRPNNSNCAVGPYQIMPYMGKQYGMRIDAQKDERKDPLKSAAVAAKILKDNLRDLGGDRSLAVLAYNKNLIWAYKKKCRREGKPLTAVGFMNEVATQIDTIRKKIKDGTYCTEDLARNGINVATMSAEKRAELFYDHIAARKENMEYLPKFGGILKATKKILYGNA